MTIAYRAHQVLGSKASMFHAASPAVPVRATARVRHFADAFGWDLVVLDAGEFEDDDYLANPANRCLFCKTNLYGTIARETDRQLVSGTNLDDLDDFRPGLEAAKAHNVRHPFVEAGIAKNGVRALARAFGLDDLAELPAAPCLSSRVETGIAIDAAALPRIDAVEEFLRRELGPETVRCRMRRSGVVIELDEASHERLDDIRRSGLRREIAGIMQRAESGVAFAIYRRGSAFVRVGGSGS